MGNLFKKLKSSKYKLNETLMVAVFNFNASKSDELSFKKNDILYVIKNPEELWLTARHEKTGKSGVIPRNFVVDFNNKQLLLPAWQEMSQAESNQKLMMPEYQVGTYIIRPSSDKRHLVLSIKTNDTKPEVKHYKISFSKNVYFIHQNRTFTDLSNLIAYYSDATIGLKHTLTLPYSMYSTPLPPARDVQIDRSQVKIKRKIGEGNFGQVFLADFKKTQVAIKILHQATDDKEKFLKEAKLMFNLQQQCIVKILGICIEPESEPVLIVTEFMEKGALDMYLRGPQGKSLTLLDLLIILMQITEGMAYLECKSFLHRDLRTANILLDKTRNAKVADFGLARLIEEVYVQTEKNYQFPVRWMAVEVIRDNKFTKKSDIWSFGVLMYEVLTFGGRPYGNMSTSDVIKFVMSGKVMKRPTLTRIPFPKQYYSIMYSCWKAHRERPSFQVLSRTFRKWVDDFEDGRETTDDEV